MGCSFPIPDLNNKGLILAYVLNHGSAECSAHFSDSRFKLVEQLRSAHVISDMTVTVPE